MKHNAPYHLQTLFDLRLNLKAKAEEAFLQAKLESQRESQKLETLEKKLKEDTLFRQQKENQYLQTAAAGHSKIQDLQIQGIHIDLLKTKELQTSKNILLQKKRLEEAIKTVQTKSIEMLRQSADFEVMAKLKERWIKEKMQIRERKEEEKFEEIATFKHGSKGRKA